MSSHAVDVPYAQETWTTEEADVLRRYFTNLEGPVFALVNLPEVVKGALFARYSRSAKSLRRLFLDEFVGDLDMSGDHGVDATVGLARAEQLYDRVFFEYGDDSVAQLGGVHLACEQASNLLTKVLERGRLMSYMEKSTRYVAYDTRLPSGRYRYYRGPEILASPLGARYVGDMDRMFDAYRQLLPVLYDYFSERHPKAEGDSDFAHRQALKAKAFDTVRGLLPSAATSNVGIYGSGQAYESLLLRMRAHPLPEARDYSDLMLTELRKVIPSWVRRVDVADRGSAWSKYREQNDAAMTELAGRLFGPDGADGASALSTSAGPEVALVDWDPRAEVKVVTAMLYPYSHLSEQDLASRVEAMPLSQRIEVMAKYSGERLNRRHRPGRALERCSYRFRRDLGLRGLQGPAKAPSPHHRMAGPHSLPRLHHARSGDRRRGGPGLRRSHEPFGRALRGARGVFRPDSCRLRRHPGPPGALQRPVERPRRHAHAGTPHYPPGPSRVPGRLPADAPLDSGQSGPRCPGRNDAVRGPLGPRGRARARPGALARRAAGRGPPAEQRPSRLRTLVPKLGILATR